VAGSKWAGDAVLSKPFTAKPYQGLILDHQQERARGATWAGMGMGKTSATLTALMNRELTDGAFPALVVAPLRVAQSTWPDEAKKWQHTSGLRVAPVVGGIHERRAALLKPAEIYSINYENLPWLTEHLDGKWPFRSVVADESTKLKGFRLRQGGQRARALARVAHKTPYWQNLTGTPSPNGIKDLWGQSWFLDAGHRLGRTFSAFTDRWFRPTHDGYGVEPLPHAQREIEDRLRDICLSLDAKDWFDLREPVVNTIYVDLPGKARQLYDDMEKRMFLEVEGRQAEAFNAASRTMKCLQLANGAIYLDPDADDDNHPKAKDWKEIHDVKIQALESVVEEAAGAPVLVAYHFKSDLARLSRAFPQGRQLDADPETIRAWNEGRIAVLFAHPASAGHGLNLQDGGNIIAFFGHNWNLEEFQQIIERIGPTRQAQAGHDRPVFIHHIVARNTVDELVMARRDSKREVQDLLMAAVKRGRT